MNNDFKNKYQTILLLDVIEHIENPTDFIQELLKQYSTVTHIIITVPARKEVWSGYDVFFGHYRRYNLAMVSELLKEIRFKPIRTKYFFHSLYLPGYLGALHILKRPVKVKTPKGAMKVIHNLMAGFLYIDYLLFPDKFVGTSIICIASRI